MDALGHRSDRSPSGLRQDTSLRFEHLFVTLFVTLSSWIRAVPFLVLSLLPVC